MASINQLISEIAHAVGQPNNIPLRRNIKYAIIHTRNELIRHGYEIIIMLIRDYNNELR